MIDLAVVIFVWDKWIIWVIAISEVIDYVTSHLAYWLLNRYIRVRFWYARSRPENFEHLPNHLMPELYSMSSFHRRILREKALVSGSLESRRKAQGFLYPPDSPFIQLVPDPFTVALSARVIIPPWNIPLWAWVIIGIVNQTFED